MSTAELAPLTTLQCDVLERFFNAESGFFLTGGAALSGFYLHHRSTSDLDLFTTSDDALTRGRTTLPHIAAALGCRFAWKHESPDFRRAVLSRDNEALVVDSFAIGRRKHIRRSVAATSSSTVSKNCWQTSSQPSSGVRKNATSSMCFASSSTAFAWKTRSLSPRRRTVPQRRRHSHGC